MDINVTSHDQSGGITAESVNIGQITKSGKLPKRQNLWKKIVVGTTTLAAAAAIFTYIGLKPSWGQKDVSNSGNTFNVNSYNQSGGITAGQVNIGPQPRKLDANARGQLLKLLPHDKKVTVVAVMGDGEAFQFAEEITKFLKVKGYNVDGVSQAVYSAPVLGQSIQQKGDGFEVVIGTRQ